MIPEFLTFLECSISSIDVMCASLKNNSMVPKILFYSYSSELNLIHMCSVDSVSMMYRHISVALLGKGKREVDNVYTSEMRVHHSEPVQSLRIRTKMCFFFPVMRFWGGFRNFV